MAIAINPQNIYGTPTHKVLNDNEINVVEFSEDEIVTTSNLLPLWANSTTYSEDKNLFVAVGRSSIANSFDGITFSRSNLPNQIISIDLTSIIYAENKGIFVAVGDGIATIDGSPVYGSFLLYSVDGITFNMGGLLYVPRIYSITYSEDKNLFVAVGAQGYIAYSSDGINFTRGTSFSVSVDFRSVVYSKNKGSFVAVGTGIVVLSQDGKSYIQGDIVGGLWTSVTYAENKNLFVAVEYSGLTSYSIDGLRFTSSNRTYMRLLSITYSENKNLFVTVGSGVIMYSDDGYNFYQGIFPLKSWTDITYAKNKDMFLVVSDVDNSFVISSNGKVFTNEKFTVLTHTKKIGEGYTNHKLVHNELLQKNTLVGGQGIGENNSKSIISKWKNGKETISLKVQYGEYYDEQSNLILSTKENDIRMSFEIGDIILPLKPTAAGIDVPYSKYLNGEAKRYRITQVKITQKGVIMQELDCQEET